MTIPLKMRWQPTGAGTRLHKSLEGTLLIVCFTAGASGGSSGGGGLSGLAMPFVRGAHLRSHATRPYTFSNSPVNGLLYVRGTIGRLPALQAFITQCIMARHHTQCRLHLGALFVAERRTSHCIAGTSLTLSANRMTSPILQLP